MGIIIEAIITGILTGGVYALMASGLTLVFGVMEIINIAQGILVILGAYLSFVLQQYLNIDLFLGLLITMPVMFGFGLLIEWLFIRPLKRDRTMLSLLVMYGLALVIEGVLPFLVPTLWRDTFRRLTEMTDGQIRFIGLTSMLAGLLLLFIARP